MDYVMQADIPKIVFIGGTGRCGTNITKDILSQHPKVATHPFEYRFIIDPDGIVDFYRSYTATWSPYLADRRLKRLENLLAALSREPAYHHWLGKLLKQFDKSGKIISPRRYYGWRLDRHLPNFREHSQALIEELMDFSFSARWVGTESYTYHPQIYFAGPKRDEELATILGKFVNKVILDFLKFQNKEFYVEDNTWNFLFARELLQLAPQSKLLHIYRDPRDVVASFVQQNWAPSELCQAAEWYKTMMYHWFNIREQLPVGSYYEYSLESLVDSPKQTLENLCKFVGLSYDPIFLEVDLSKSHQGRWREDFDIDEQKILQKILGDVIAKLGYKEL